MAERAATNLFMAMFVESGGVCQHDNRLPDPVQILCQRDKRDLFAPIAVQPAVNEQFNVVDD
jgi:hypothetical protein